LISKEDEHFSFWYVSATLPFQATNFAEPLN